MAAVKTKRISTLIESQLPEFITTEYELFSKFVQKYYEQQEVQGGTLDIINNIQKYADIDYYEKNLLNGKVVNYDSLGFKISETEYKMGIRDGVTKIFDNGLRGIVPVNDDEIKHFLTYKNDTLNGKVETDYGYFGDSLKIEGNFTAH